MWFECKFFLNNKVEKTLLCADEEYPALQYVEKVNKSEPVPETSKTSDNFSFIMGVLYFEWEQLPVTSKLSYICKGL